MRQDRAQFVHGDPLTISTSEVDRVRKFIQRYPDFNHATTSSPLRTFVEEELQHYKQFAASVRPLLDSGDRFAILNARDILSTDLEVSKFLLLAFTSCFGTPTATDQIRKTIAWEVTPRPTLPQGHKPTITEHRMAAAPHTDSSYRRMPEKYVALFVVRPAETGGGLTEIVDGREVVRQLGESAAGRRCEELLRSSSYPFRVPDSFTSGNNSSNEEFIREAILADEPFIRFRYDSVIEGLAGNPILDTEEIRWSVDFLRNEVGICKKSAFRLEAGDLLLTNNHEILHGRTSFESKARLLLRVRAESYC